MHSKLKRFLAGFMLAGDLLLLPFFFIDALSTGDGISWFLAAFFAVDAYLTVDYMKEMTQQVRQDEYSTDYEKREYARNLTKAQLARKKRLDDDRQMAEEIRRSTEINEMDPDELREMLSGQTAETFEHGQKAHE